MRKLIVKNWKLIKKELLEFLSSFKIYFFEIMFEGIKIVTTLNTTIDYHHPNNSLLNDTTRRVYRASIFFQV